MMSWWGIYPATGFREWAVLVIAGAGDDNVLGDADWVPVTLDWYYLDDVQTVYAASTFNGAETVRQAVPTSSAGSGNDYIWGGGGDDIVFGEQGHDRLVGQAGSTCWLAVQATTSCGVMWPPDLQHGADYLDGGRVTMRSPVKSGADVLIGGWALTRSLAVREGYLCFGRGDGIETIFDPDDRDGTLAAQSANVNPDKSVIVFGEGIDRTQVKFRRGSLLIDLGEGDAIHLTLPSGQTDPAASRVIDQLQFADGSVMTFDDILAQGFDIDGTEGNDNSESTEPPMLVGTGVTDRVRGFGGDDILFGLGGSDALEGGADSDQLYGDNSDLNDPDYGNDSLDGGADNDLLYGNKGSDTLLGGDGADQLYGDSNDLNESNYGNDLLDGGARAPTLRQQWQ
jgi:Ca2+-binding RTX toxin-like protein